MKASLVPLATVAFALMAVCGERPEGEGLDAEGGHTDRTPASTTYPPGKKDGEGQESGCNDRPRHDPTLDVDWVRENGRIAPYTCETFTSVRDVDIEHIVAWAEARRSGLSCADARAFVNDPLNITVAYPRLNRQKSDKDIADWQPQRNACWFAARVKAVKAKYGLTMDDPSGERSMPFCPVVRLRSGRLGGANSSLSLSKRTPRSPRPFDSWSPAHLASNPLRKRERAGSWRAGPFSLRIRSEAFPDPTA